MFEKFLNKRFYSQDQLNEDLTYKRRNVLQLLAEWAYQISNWFKLISATDSRFVISIFGIWLILLGLIYPFNDSEFFIGNLYPELIGFGLEGLILLGVFSLLLERKESSNHEKIRLSIRLLLKPFVLHINEQFNKSSKYKVDYSNPETIYFIIRLWITEYIVAPQKKKKNCKKYFRKHSEDIMSDLDLFIPVMARISPELMKLLLKAKRHLKELADKELDEQRFIHSVIDILGIIAEFDERNFSGLRLKKNIQQLMNLELISRAN